MKIQEQKLRNIVRSEIDKFLNESATDEQKFTIGNGRFDAVLETSDDGITLVVYPRNESAKRMSPQEIMDGLGQRNPGLLRPIETPGDDVSGRISRVFKFRVDAYNLRSRIVKGLIFK